jgi:hypothetical protein
MNRNKWMYAVLGGALLMGTSATRAQRPAPGGPPPPFGGPMELMGFEGGHGGRVVKGAPFSATATAETTQTLPDGTSIHQTAQSTFHRDSQGRSRREVTLSGFGAFAATGKTHTLVMIADPVAGARYSLETESKVARQSSFAARGGKRSGTHADAFEQKMQARMQAEEASGAVKKESLGTQEIHGASAEGTRITRTIPVGQMGNDKPILVVMERWYSPDLQIVVKSTRTDPRFGTTTYTVTNLQRAEPATTLFAVPADYTVKQGGPSGNGHGRGWGKHGAPPSSDVSPMAPPPAEQ